MKEITKERLKELEKAEAKLLALENGGVDNWVYYDECLTEYNKDQELESDLDELMEEVEVAIFEGAYEPSERGAGFAATEDSREDAKDIILAFMKKQKEL